MPIDKARRAVGLLAPPAMVAKFRRARRHRALAEKPKKPA